MQDGNITDHAVATIEKMASGGFGADVASGKRPFFLAVGFHKPHVRPVRVRSTTELFGGVYGCVRI